MKPTELFLGLDVHKDSITAAGAEGGRDGEVRHLGSIANELHALERLIAKLRGPAKRPLQVCYEAGPCGFVIARRLAQLGVPCAVVAPSLIPRKPGDQIKKDRQKLDETSPPRPFMVKIIPETSRPGSRFQSRFALQT